LRCRSREPPHVVEGERVRPGRVRDLGQPAVVIVGVIHVGCIRIGLLRQPVQLVVGVGENPHPLIKQNPKDAPPKTDPRVFCRLIAALRVRHPPDFRTTYRLTGKRRIILVCLNEKTPGKA